MKNKTKVVLIMLFSFVMLTAGICTAYRNTCELAFDDEPIIFSADEEKITFLDFTISKSKCKKIYRKIVEFFPDDTVVVRESLF